MRKFLDRREVLKHSAALVAISQGKLLLAGEENNQPAGEPWPTTNGPNGNYTAPRYGCNLVSDLRQVRRVWTSQDNDLGFAKGSVSGYISNLVRRPAHPGSGSGPIVAAGKIFSGSFRPTGDVWAENQPQLRNIGNRYNAEQMAHLRRQLRINADDLLLAIDQRTGRTAWKAVEEGKGLNRYMGKREGFGVAPAFHDAKVFSMGSTGRLYAYAADTGRKLWESTIGRGHEIAEQLKHRCLQDKVIPGNLGWSTSLTVIGGTLVVPLFNGPVNISLRGVNPENGQTIWERPGVISRYGTPSWFCHEGQEYIVTANVRGELRLIDPRNGRIVWTVENLGPHYFSLLTLGNMVFVNIGSVTPRREGDSRRYGRLAGYRLSLSGAERVWALPDERRYFFQTWMDSCARRFLACRDDLLFFKAYGNEPADRKVYIIRASTGEVLANQQFSNNSMQMFLVDDRLLTFRDAAHGNRLTMQLYTADPNNFRALGEEWRPPQTSTTAYEVFMEYPYVDGRFYMRSEAGDIRCYDLRQRG